MILKERNNAVEGNNFKLLKLFLNIPISHKHTHIESTFLSFSLSHKLTLILLKWESDPLFIQNHIFFDGVRHTWTCKKIKQLIPYHLCHFLQCSKLRGSDTVPTWRNNVLQGPGPWVAPSASITRSPSGSNAIRTFWRSDATNGLTRWLLGAWSGSWNNSTR